MNNHKQLVLGWTLYAADFDDKCANNFTIPGTEQAITSGLFNNRVNKIMSWRQAVRCAITASPTGCPIPLRRLFNRHPLLGLLSMEAARPHSRAQLKMLLPFGAKVLLISTLEFFQ
ncbi:MAG: hypothetical protein M2R45_02821 [Verrucomicrobia subdivision 3 bacterium]|nr:hypothetical protein [Limisphaerales bacterium]MCS1415476.1 hypothetical protein [Limisphaerales bacterium]